MRKQTGTGVACGRLAPCFPFVKPLTCCTDVSTAAVDWQPRAAQHNGVDGHVLKYRNVSKGRRDVELNTSRHGLSVRPATLMQMCSHLSSESRRWRAVGTRLQTPGRQKWLYAAADLTGVMPAWHECYATALLSCSRLLCHEHAAVQLRAAGKKFDTLTGNSCSTPCHRADASAWGLR